MKQLVDFQFHSGHSDSRNTTGVHNHTQLQHVIRERAITLKERK